MKKKRNLASFFAGVMTVLLAFGCLTSAMAASGEVTYNFANVTLNGEKKISAGSDMGNIFIAMLFLLRQYEICVFHFCLFCLFACTMGNTEVRKSGFIIGHTRYTFYSLQFCVVSAW